MWWDAITNSKRYKELVKMHNSGTSYLSYLLRDQELWARSYSQYIATKSKNSAKLKEMTEEYGEKSQFNIQRNDDDFVSISSAIDNLFSSLGWIK